MGETGSAQLYASTAEIKQAKTLEQQRIAARELSMPDGRRILVAAENDEEVHINVVSPSGQRELKTLSRSDFDALNDEFEAHRNGEAPAALIVEDAPLHAEGTQEAPSATLSDGSKATYIGKDELAGHVVRIENTDGTAEDKLLSGDDLKELGLPNPYREVETVPFSPSTQSNEVAEGKPSVDVSDDKIAEVKADQAGAEPATIEVATVPELETADSLREQLAVDQKAYEQADRGTTAKEESLQKLEETNLKLHRASVNEKESEPTPANATPESAPAEAIDPDAPATAEDLEYLARVAGSAEAPVAPVAEAAPEVKPAESTLPDASRAFWALGRERKLAKEQPSLVNVEEAFKKNPEYQSIRDNLTLAQDRYTQLKVKSETWGWIGRRKREVELTKAEQALKNAEIVYAKAMTDAKVEAGLLNSENPEEARYLQGEQLFCTQRGLINDRRKNVRKFREDKIEHRNGFMKAVAGVGNFLNSGGKWSKRLKGAGLVASGAGMGVETALSGLGWPITLAASSGIGYGIRGASLVDRLDKQAADIGVEGADHGIITDDMFDAFMENFKQSTHTAVASADQLGQVSLDASRAQGYANADAARREANIHSAKYGIGFAIGAGATLLTTSGILNPTAHAGTGPSSPQIAPLQPDNYHAPFADMSGHEFASGADRITNGEGWFHQFRDMGMSDKQAHALFGDKNVMKQLVDAHAAYVDNSARIGGYGINMPKGGHLSQQAMDIIGKALDAKGIK